jgi:hypothetical protein
MNERLAKLLNRYCPEHYEGERIYDPHSIDTGWEIKNLRQIDGEIPVSVISFGICGIDKHISDARETGQTEISGEVACGKCGKRKHAELHRFRIIEI